MLWLLDLQSLEQRTMVKVSVMLLIGLFMFCTVVSSCTYISADSIAGQATLTFWTQWPCMLLLCMLQALFAHCLACPMRFTC